MKNISLVSVVAFVGGCIAGCQQIDGACWPANEDGNGAGAGGGPIVPGWGGYGDEPQPKPLGSANYPTDPCMQQAECTVTWKIGSDSCANAGDAGCTSLHRGHYSSLDDAKKDCERVYGINPATNSGAMSCDACKWVGSASAGEECRRQCDKEWETRNDECRKLKNKDARAKCWEDSNLKYAECLKKCPRD